MSLRFWKARRASYNEDSPNFTMAQSYEVLRRLCEEALGRPVYKSEVVAITAQEVAEKKGWHV